MTVTAPADPAGVLAVIVLEFATSTFVAAVAPKRTVAPLVKLLPVIATVVPPVVGPLVGAMLVTLGFNTGAVKLTSFDAVLVKPEVFSALTTK